jgi:hypothetical protein
MSLSLFNTCKTPAFVTELCFIFYFLFFFLYDFGTNLPNNTEQEILQIYLEAKF